MYGPARLHATQPGGIGSLESILGLLKSLKIRALFVRKTEFLLSGLLLLSYGLSCSSQMLYCSYKRPSSSFQRFCLGLAFPQKKLFRGRRNRRNNWFVPAEFRLFRGTENSRNSVPNRSADEKNARNSLPWNKIRCKRSESRSELFRGRDNNSEFRSSERNRTELRRKN